MKFLTYLTEKQIIIGGGKKYGQIVFLAGGAGSGKDFAINNFMESHKFKVFDVDELKQMFIKLNKQKKLFPEITGFDMKNPKDVFSLHKYVSSTGIKNKIYNLIFSQKDEETLPNLIFNVTLKDFGELYGLLEKMESVGYKSSDIHVVWVLAEYDIAVMNNRGRERVVPDDILLTTHEGVPLSMLDIFRGKLDNIDGSISVVISDPKLTIFYTDEDGNPITNTKGQKIIKDFTYLTVKKSGKSISDELEIKTKLLELIKKHIPKTSKTKDIFSLDPKDLF